MFCVFIKNCNMAVNYMFNVHNIRLNLSSIKIFLSLLSKSLSKIGIMLVKIEKSFSFL